MTRADSDKNAKAGSLTGLVCGALLFLAAIISWKPPIPVPPPSEEGMEVNLGDGDLGEGTEPPLSPLPLASQSDEAVSTPKIAEAPSEPPKEVETDDNDKEAPDVVAPKPTVKPPEKKTPTPPKENPKPIIKSPAKPVTKPVTNPVKPQTPKPKFVYKGGGSNANGGNESDTWNQSKGQGINGGKGDQGRQGGNPDSDNYKGAGGGGSGVSIQKGLTGRNITLYPSFEDDFSENAKVAVEVRVDAQGNVTSAVFQPRGSTTNDVAMRNIAIKKARQLKFNAQAGGPETDIGTIVFNFRVK